MKTISKLILTALLLISINTVFGQSGDVSYPLSVECSENSLQPGELAVFTAKFSPKIKTDDLTFNWTTTAGDIVEGQGTPVIKIKLPESGSSVTADLRIRGSALWEGSQRTVSCTVSIIQTPQPRLITETGYISAVDADFHINGYLQEFEMSLMNDPSASGYIISYQGIKGGIKEVSLTQREIRKWSDRKIDPSRLTFVDGGKRGKTLFQFYLVPAGATPPVPSEDPADKNKFIEFSAAVKCGEVWANLDNLFTKLENDAGSTGHIAVYGEKSKTVRNFIRELQIKNYIEFKKFDSSRIIITRGEMRDDAMTEFWVVPAGEETPQITAAQWSYKFPKTTRPFVLGGSYSDGVPGCGGYEPKLYAEFLNANPNLVGEVRIKETSPAKFRVRETEVLNELVKDNKIPRAKIKIIFLKLKPNSPEESTELWFTPSRRK